ncbi:MAG: LysM peptidoglycan-binding domain-containing protein [Solirubrobacteraceae bacterium]
MAGKYARLLAPIALASVTVGVYLVVHSSLETHANSSATSTPALSRSRDTRHERPTPKYYLVKSGDTLSGVAAKTGVSLARLAALNPSVSAPPYSLQTGQRLRLRR